MENKVIKGTQHLGLSSLSPQPSGLAVCSTRPRYEKSPYGMIGKNQHTKQKHGGFLPRILLGNLA